MPQRLLRLIQSAWLCAGSEDPLEDVVSEPARNDFHWRLSYPSVPNFQLTERVAIVTGASRGLGSAIAEGLAEQGARVVLSSRKQDDLDREAARLNERFPGAAVAMAAHPGGHADL